MKINPHLIWDYSFAPEEYETESFRRFYIARVLMRGGLEDIRAIGIDLIQRYLPSLNLPVRIHEFWDWYFQTHPKGGPSRKS